MSAKSRLGIVQRTFHLWLLLGGVFLASTLLVAINTALMVRSARGHFGNICAAAQDAFEHGGPEALSLLLRGVSAGPKVRVHLLDAHNRDLATGEYRPRPTVAKSPGGLGAPAIVAETNQYSCVLEPPEGVPLMVLGPVTWVLLFVSLLCWSVGAYVTWRVRKIEVVIRHFGSGALTVRTASEAPDAIGRLATAFNEMAERIESLVESHQRLCADMAHELRSPLSRLLLAVRGARCGEAGSLDRLEGEAARINDLVAQLLDIARAEVDPDVLDLEPLDLESLLIEIADHCRVEAAERRCDIDLVFEAPGLVTADAELLRRAIENVLRNAIQHTPQNTRIRLFGGGGPEQATVSVRDWGPGVPDDVLACIFRPFYRVDTARARTTGGVGLGLSIAQRAIAVHGGTMFAENCAPGLQVVIRIPRR